MSKPKTPISFKVKELEVVSVSLVKQGANQYADIMMTKSKENKQMNEQVIKIDLDAVALGKAIGEQIAPLKGEDAGSTEDIVKSILPHLEKTMSDAVEKRLKDFEAMNADECVNLGDAEIKKSVVGEEVFKALKLEAENVSKMKEEAISKSFEAEALKSYPKAIGTAEQKGAFLKAVDKMDKVAKEFALSLIKSANELGDTVTKSVGTSTPNTTDGLSEVKELEKRFDEIAQEYAIANKVHKAVAKSKIITENKEAVDILNQIRLISAQGE